MSSIVYLQRDPENGEHSEEPESSLDTLLFNVEKWIKAIPIACYFMNFDLCGYIYEIAKAWQTLPGENIIGLQHLYGEATYMFLYLFIISCTLSKCVSNIYQKMLQIQMT